MRESKDVPTMDATLLVSQWTGEYGLRNELRQKEVAAGRTLTGNAESVCEFCLGTGWKTEIVGGYSSAVKCDHGNV